MLHMKVPVLILMLLVPWFVHAQSQFYGSRISGLALMGAGSEDDLQRVPLHVGDTLTPENVRASIESLYGTGSYNSVEVDAEPAPNGGTNLTFIVRPHYYFATFRLEPAHLLERSLSTYSRIPLGEKFSESTVQRIIDQTKELLKSEGYFEATIASHYDYDDANRLVFVTLKAEPGPRARIGDIKVQGGEQTFQPGELLGAFKIDPGDDFSSAKLEEGVGKAAYEICGPGVFEHTR